MQAVGFGAAGPPSELHLPTAMTDSVSTMTSSMTSSLTSPGDSGVALLDSEAEATSVSEDVLEGATPAEENPPKSPVFRLENMTNSDIANGNTPLESNSEEVIVFRRRSKMSRSSRHSDPKKRVSFHEELVKTEPDGKHDETKERSTWCQETPIQRSESSSSSGGSLSNEFTALNCGSSTPSDSKLEIRCSPPCRGGKELPRLRTGREQSVAGVLSAVRSLIAGSPSAAARSMQSVPVTERGAPEGQEDPPLSASTLDLYHHADIAERLRDGEPLKHSSADSDCGSGCAQPASPHRLPISPSRSPHLRQTRRFCSSGSSNSSILREAPSKSCLVNRFLRSLTEKKLQSTRSASTTLRRRNVHRSDNVSDNLNKFGQLLEITCVKGCMCCRAPTQSLYIKGARPVEELSKEILDELEEEIRSAVSPVPTCPMELTVTPVIREKLLADVLETRIENPCKIYQVRLCSKKNKSEVMLAVLTERAIYLINHLWKAPHVLLLAHLESILLGPGSHWVRLYSNEGVPRNRKAVLKEMTLLLGDVASTRQLVSHIELAVRRLSLPGRRIPAVHRFSLEDLSSSPSWSAVLLGEAVHHSAVVHAADVCPSPPSTPLGPLRRGYFMFSHINGRGHIWTAGYFVLKAGVLYQFASEEKRMPILSLPMANLKPRLATHSRPHTIEVGHLLLAAPDEATSSDWLRALVRAASGDASECPVEDGGTPSQIATFVLTEERILLLAGLDSSAPVLLVVPLNDLVSMQTGDEGESWCVLDLACREASESIGDFVVYFATCSEMHSFKDSMRRIRPVYQEIWTKIPHYSSLRPRCQKMQSELSSSWNTFLSSLEAD